MRIPHCLRIRLHAGEAVAFIERQLRFDHGHQIVHYVNYVTIKSPQRFGRGVCRAAVCGPACLHQCLWQALQTRVKPYHHRIALTRDRFTEPIGKMSYTGHRRLTSLLPWLHAYLSTCLLADFCYSVTYLFTHPAENKDVRVL